MDKNIFKKYDIRGVYPSQVNEEIFYNVGLVLTKILGGKIIIGRDSRLSSDKLSAALALGVKESGGRVLAVGMISSPMLSFLSKKMKCGGVIVTASHNPKEFNGIKIIGSKGFFIGGERVGKLIGKLKKFSRRNKTVGEERDFSKIYSDFLLGFLRPERKLKVVVDLSSGSLGNVFSHIKRTELAEFILINDRPDGNFPSHDPNPLKDESIIAAGKKILEKKADIGFVFDADGDRVVVLDEKGKRMRPEIVAQIILSDGGNKMVYEETCSFWIGSVKKEFPQTKFFKSRVGHLFVKEKMAQTKSDFGFESSGHFYFKDFYFFDSGAMAMLKTINSLSKIPYRLSDLTGLIPPAFKIKEENLFVSRSKKNSLFKKAERLFSKKKGRISYFDGISFDGSSVFVNLRFSETEDVLRLNVEGSNKKEVADWRKRIIFLIKSI